MDMIGYIIYFTMSIFLSIALVVVYILFLKPTPKLHLLKKIGETYQLVKTLKFKMSETSKKYKDKTYVLDLKDALNWKRNKPHLFKDIDDCTSLSFKAGQTYDAKMLQTLIDNHMLKGIFGKDQEKLLIIVILVLVICLVISVSFNMYVVSNPAAFMPPPVNATLPVSNISPIV